MSHCLAVGGGRQEMPSRPAMLRNGTVGSQGPLGLSRRFKPSHPSSPLPRRLLGVLGAIVQGLKLWCLTQVASLAWRCYNF